MSTPHDDQPAAGRAGAGREYWDEVEDAFAAALSAGDAAHTAILDAHCGARADLRADVESLLAAHARAGAFITPHTLHDAGAGVPADDPGAGLPAGSRIGAFRVLAHLAQGGMGEVYRAERVEGDFSQQVAIKLIAATLQGADTVRRFHTERQILASLQHPSIVAVVDGGVTASGQPYLAMEYVDGLPLTKFCHARALPIEARLRLFQQVCAAAAFAHRHLVVHRDLKPANVLVTAEGHVKVLDFGIAKLLEPDAAPAAATLSLVGPLTPDYTSPEQIRGLPVTTACDVYALGVMLYELLAGARPYETSGKTMDEILALIVEREPSRPSAACSDGVPYDPRRLRGDLDAIVLRAMAKTPERRYASAEDLNEDVDRFLAGRPVQAREPSLAYLARKAIARHRAAFALTGVFVVLLAAAVVSALWQAHIAGRERERAVQRFNDVRELASSLIFRIHDEVAALPGSTPVRQSVIAEGMRFLERLEQDAGGDADQLLELARAYLRLGRVQGQISAANLGDTTGAVRSFRKARDIAAALARSSGPSWDITETLTGAHLQLSSVLNDLEPEEARSAGTAALASASAWHRREPHSVRARVLLARSHFHMALLQNDPLSGERLTHWLESNRLFGEVMAEDPDDLNKIRNLALTEKNLGGYFDENGDIEKSLEHHRRAYALDERRVEAAPDDRQAQIDLAIDIGNIGYAHEQRNRHDEAIEAYVRSLEIRERLRAADPQDVYMQGRTAFTHDRLARVYVLTGNLSAAGAHARHAVKLVEPLVGITHHYRIQHSMALQMLAEVQWRTGSRRIACDTYAAARAGFRLVEGVRLPNTQRASKATVDRALTACRAL